MRGGSAPQLWFKLRAPNNPDPGWRTSVADQTERYANIDVLSRRPRTRCFLVSRGRGIALDRGDTHKALLNCICENGHCADCQSGHRRNGFGLVEAMVLHYTRSCTNVLRCSPGACRTQPSNTRRATLCRADSCFTTGKSEHASREFCARRFCRSR